MSLYSAVLKNGISTSRKSHFVNDLLCGQHLSLKRSSCAVDSILDLHYYGMYPHFKSSMDKAFEFSNPLFSKLTAVAEFRDNGISPECEIRDDVWEYLCDEAPSAYKVKGRGDAYVSDGLNLLARGPAFEMKAVGTAVCHNCSAAIEDIVLQEDGLVTYFNAGVPHTSDLQRALEESISIRMRRVMIDTMCHKCTDKSLDSFQGTISMPEFVMTELPVKDIHKNVPGAKPGTVAVETLTKVCQAVCVPERTSILGSNYELCGAILSGGGHFTCLAQGSSGEYILIDDMASHLERFPTFASALQGNRNIKDRCVEVPSTENHLHLYKNRAPFVLVYKKMARGVAHLQDDAAPFGVSRFVPRVHHSESAVLDSFVLNDDGDFESVYNTSSGNQRTSICTDSSAPKSAEPSSSAAPKSAEHPRSAAPKSAKPPRSPATKSAKPFRSSATKSAEPPRSTAHKSAKPPSAQPLWLPPQSVSVGHVLAVCDCVRPSACSSNGGQ